VLWSHYFMKLLFYEPLISGFQTSLRKIDNGDVYVSTSPWENFQKIYFLFKTLFRNLKGMILFGHLLKPLLLWCLVAYVWLWLTTFGCVWLLLVCMNALLGELHLVLITTYKTLLMLDSILMKPRSIKESR
jgi:hypothetical protein